jgi:hypothetical protein
MTFQLAFDEPLKVSGVPVLPLSNGLKASYDPGRSTPGQGLLAFSYTPQNGDQSTDLLIAAGASLALPLGAAITDQAGNAAPLMVPGFDASVAVDAVAPQLQQLTAPGGTYGPNQTLRLSLQFNEPVGWQADSPGSVPVLQLSQGLNAAWIAPANASSQPSSIQSFDLLTGNSPPDVALLQVLGLAGQGHFMDGVGNPLVAPQASSWALPQAIRITPVSSWTLDVDRDGSVDAGEFTELMLRLQRLSRGRERLMHYLMPVDVNGDHQIDPAELRRLLGSVGQPPLTPQEERHLFDPSAGRLSWSAFIDRLLLV